MSAPIRVLYIDDNQLDRELVRDVLEKELTSFHVSEAASRAEFEAQLAEGDYDLVLSDLSILGFKGLEVLDAVHAKNPSLPVIIVTGTGSQEVAVEAMKRSAADYVLKSPNHIARLPIAIRSAFERKQLEDERMQAEKALRESESKYRDLVENINDVIYTADANGVITYISPVIEAVSGYNPSEMIGHDLAEFVHPEDLPLLRDTLGRVMSGELHSSEYRLRVKSGEVIWVRSSSRPTKFGDRAVGLRGVLADINQRKQAEKQIELELQRITSLHTIDTAISSSLDPRITLKVLIEHVTDQLLLDAADVLLLNPHTYVLEYAAARGFRTAALQYTKLHLGDGHAGRAALERQLITVADLREDPGSLVRSPGLADEGFVFYCAAPLIAKGQVKGVLEIFHRSTFKPDHEWIDFLEALAVQAAIAVDNAELFDELQRSNVELRLAYDATIEGWSRALDLRDKENAGHTQHVVEKTLQLARLMGLNEAELVHVRRGALLHDIGKMGLPDAILFKPGALTDEEWVKMRQHPQYAYETLASVAFLRPALDIPYCHHEKWDGTGYPRGLKGEEIPLGARVFAVVDVWDALTSARPYRAAWREEEAREYIRKQAGKYFDPLVVEKFLGMELPA